MMLSFLFLLYVIQHGKHANCREGECTPMLPGTLFCFILSPFGMQAGLRPARTAGIRLERDSLVLSGQRRPLVHNYGHGGCGVTLHWGCAAEAVDLVSDILAP
jgi:hypothetical protein